MAKRKKSSSNNQQQLSPENYIKQKGRSLPIHQCLITDDWKATRIANIMIARQHNNGNLTVCTYLVDLNLLGVKDTMYFFNLKPDLYGELIERFFEEPNPAIEIDYTLAHNIIYASVAYAEDYGFNPHKDFTLVTRHFLAEDDDAIELIDIECGENGKPVYVNGPFDTEIRINQILEQLEKTAGKDNFEFVYISPDEDEDDYDNMINEEFDDFEGLDDEDAAFEEVNEDEAEGDPLGEK